MRNSINKNLDIFKSMSAEEIFDDRKNKFLRIGRTKGFIDNLDDLSSLKVNKNNFDQIIALKKIWVPTVLAIIIFLISLIFIL